MEFKDWWICRVISELALSVEPTVNLSETFIDWLAHSKVC